MDRFQYVGLMAACVLVTLPLEVVVGARVWRRPVRTAKALAPAFAAFVAWDLWATRRGTWSFSERYTMGIRLPGGMVVEELLFFLIVPICALLTLEAVRILLGERPGRPVRGTAAADDPPRTDTLADDPPRTDTPRDGAPTIDAPTTGTGSR